MTQRHQYVIAFFITMLLITISTYAQEHTYHQQSNYHPIVALKTNVLFDVALSPNIELEVPLAPQWSLQGEFTRGWWLKSHTFCWQVETYGGEIRYWFNRFAPIRSADGHTQYQRVLEGWFIGAFASGGFYDFQLHSDRGVQVESLVSAGLSFGYAKRLNHRLHIEFSAGVGYTQLDYHHYDVIDNRYLLKSKPSKRYTGLLPVKAKISLVWMIYQNYKTRRRRHEILSY